VSEYNTATPYVASFVILRKNGKVAFVLRTNTAWMNGYYGLASGKVEKNESYLAAAVREAKEEAGVEVKTGDLKHLITVHRFEPSKQATDWVDVYFETTKWKGEPYNAEPEIHGELVWLDPKKLPKNIVPSVKYALEQIEAGKTYAEYGWEK
jgi:8-oxo-dGTP diphosphatase